jgi:hypothetical protein
LEAGSNVLFGNNNSIPILEKNMTTFQTLQEHDPRLMKEAEKHLNQLEQIHEKEKDVDL